MGITNKQKGGQSLSGLGRWKDIPFDPANFYGTANMIWTVDSTFQNRYSVIGSTVTWSCVIVSSALSGTINSQVALKAPTRAKIYSIGGCKIMNGTPPIYGIVQISPMTAPQPGYLAVSLPNNTPFTAGALQVYFTIAYEIDLS